MEAAVLGLGGSFTVCRSIVMLSQGDLSLGMNVWRWWWWSTDTLLGLHHNLKSCCFRKEFEMSVSMF